MYSSQGQIIDGDAFIYSTSGVNRANSYVANSRHKGNCHWFFNKKELAELYPSDVNKLSGRDATVLYLIHRPNLCWACVLNYILNKWVIGISLTGRSIESSWIGCVEWCIGLKSF